MSVLFNLEALVAGIGLIALGVVWMLANLGYLDLLNTLHRWWPSILVLWGALALARALAQRNTAGGGR
jgi:cell wall-active antibiotic response 4TMS protein YvqF